METEPCCGYCNTENARLLEQASGAVSRMVDSMSTKPMQTKENIDEKRARYEQFEFAVCHDGKYVNVRNTMYNEPGHVYSVTVDDGAVVACSCPHHKHRGVRFKHIHAVANEPVLLAAVEAAAREQQTVHEQANEKEVRADGGQTTKSKPYTTHLEPVSQGGEQYARCTRR